MEGPVAMGKLVCLLGKSSTGKDTIYSLLLEDAGLRLAPLVLYTTRPARPGEEDGKTYHFVSAQRLLELELEYGVVEKRVYDTAFGPWAYCTLNDNSGRSAGNRICITTPAAMPGYIKAFGEENVVALYITVADGLRLRRAIEREEKRDTPSYKEVCRRFLADEEDFSQDMLSSFRIYKEYDNTVLKDCLGAIKKDLLEVL